VLPSFHRLPASAQAEPAHKIAAIEAELAAGKGIRRIARLGRWRGHGASGLVA